MNIKVSGGLLELNVNVWRKEERRIGFLCNLSEEENVLYFLCFWPILDDVRMRCFREGRLTRERRLSILNWEDRNHLYEFVCGDETKKAKICSESNEARIVGAKKCRLSWWKQGFNYIYSYKRGSRTGKGYKNQRRMISTLNLILFLFFCSYLCLCLHLKC